jgi:hypothetical protein
LPDNLRGLKLGWTRKIKRDEEGGSISIYTPWYFKKESAYFAVSIIACVVLGYILTYYDISPWLSLSAPFPAVFGTAWVDGNTGAAPKFSDMDGVGGALVNGDTISLATKNLVADADKTPGAVTITLGTLTSSAGTTYTLGGNLLVDAGTTSVSGTITPLTYTCQFDGAVTVNSGGVLGDSTAWTCNLNANLTCNGVKTNLGTGTKNIAAGVTVTANTYVYVGSGVMNGGGVDSTILTGANIVYGLPGTDPLHGSEDLTINNFTDSSTATLTFFSGPAGILRINGSIKCAGAFDATAGALTISAGVTITMTDSTKTFLAGYTNSGVITANGTALQHITITGMKYAMFKGDTTCTLSYIDMVGASTVATVACYFYTAYSAAIDNISVTSLSSSTYGGTGINAVGVVITNSTFANLKSGDPSYSGSICDLKMYTGKTLMLDNCAFSVVTMQATSGWVVSKTHGGVANATRIYGILNADSPAAAYQIGDADDVSLLNADAYYTAFNTQLTINQNETCHTITPAHDASYIVNTGITLTVT